MNYMQAACNLAEKAMQNSEVPVGCVIVDKGKIIGCGYNKKETTKIAICHAEIMAIVDACKYKKDWRLDGCEMYITLSPCMMCMGAIIESRIDKVYYLLDSTFYTNKCFAFNSFNNNLKYDDIILEDKYSKLLSDFFKNRRK